MWITSRVSKFVIFFLGPLEQDIQILAKNALDNQTVIQSIMRKCPSTMRKCPSMVEFTALNYEEMSVN